jgi:hypothetical protein
MREGESLSAKGLLARMVGELRTWRPESKTQQDDITLIVIDVL